MDFKLKMNENWKKCGIILLLTLTYLTVTVADGQYEDDRCKCVCPSQKGANGTEDNRRIYVQTNILSDFCKCKFVVNPPADRVKEICPTCECKFEVRNTTTIKVVVIFIICVVSLLVIYMLFLLCLDPLMNRRPKTYQEQQNEEVNLGGYQAVGDDQTVTTSSANAPPGGRVRASSLVNRVKDTQEKWKGVVQEQRRHIYDQHTMLN
ncbi:proton-transporting V-type ATPase complex assembly regulator TMEM9-like isoform X2 [Tubulanus polymorphus]|uniref:proton-transporting V-type ATPase complex assembly regulator TMEM9-like isoform X2 n=1 Tax=Tubulanus polymorphus TaxID=672921 RepID=UPI003DA63912